MGCASSGRQVLCKGQGVENDRTSFFSKPKGAMADVNNMRNEVHSAVADATHAGADIMGNITEGGGMNHARRISFEHQDSITQRMGNFENRIIQNGTDAMGDLKKRGEEQMSDVVETLEDMESTAEDHLKHGAEDFTKEMKEIAHKMEDEVLTVTETIKDKYEDVKDDVGKVIDDLTGKEKPKPDSHDEMGEKIDELIATIDKS